MSQIPIGRFSKMTRLSIKALRLYDETGLLRPATVDAATGYRYYAPEQANRAEAIRILRSIDMPLDEIRAVLDSTEQRFVEERLVAHRERLASRLAEQERMLRYLEAIIRRQEIVMSYRIDLTEVPPQTIAAVRFNTTLSRISADIGAAFGRLMSGLARGRAAPAGIPFCVYHEVIDEETAGDVEVGVPVSDAFSGDDDVGKRTLEGGTMATTLHTGPYEEIGQAYQALTGWIAAEGLEIAGPPREFYLNDPRSVAPPELETRLEFPVAKPA